MSKAKITGRKREEITCFFNDILAESQKLLEQIESGKDMFYTRSSDLVSAAESVGLEFSVGVDPDSGEKMFVLYLPDWAK